MWLWLCVCGCCCSWARRISLQAAVALLCVCVCGTQCALNCCVCVAVESPSLAHRGGRGGRARTDGRTHGRKCSRHAAPKATARSSCQEPMAQSSLSPDRAQATFSSRAELCRLFGLFGLCKLCKLCAAAANACACASLQQANKSLPPPSNNLVLTCQCAAAANLYWSTVRLCFGPAPDSGGALEHRAAGRFKQAKCQPAQTEYGQGQGV